MTIDQIVKKYGPMNIVYKGHSFLIELLYRGYDGFLKTRLYGHGETLEKAVDDLLNNESNKLYL